jgi:hypothetical protein
VHIIARDAPRSALLLWLPKFIILSLHVEVQAAPDTNHHAAIISGMQQGLHVSDLLQHDGNSFDNLTNLWTLRSLRGLENLEIGMLQTAASFYHTNHFFMCRALQPLSCLRRLSLSGYFDYELEGLPPSLDCLRVEYAGKWTASVLSSHGISVLTLPPNVCLETLHVSKNGVLGIVANDLTERCLEVTIDAKYVLLGVSIISDPTLVTAFERPYREGDYVPPHILGDMDAVELSNMAADRSAAHLLTALAESPKLHRLTFSGECATSVKLIPCSGAVTNEHSPVSTSLAAAQQISWVHNITKQATLYLYGMSGAELLDRLLDLRAAGRLSETALNIAIEDDQGSFTIGVTAQAVCSGGDLESDGSLVGEAALTGNTA